MKTSMIVLTAILALNINVLFAGNSTLPTSFPLIKTSSLLVSLAPVVPIEATFEDVLFAPDYSELIPVIPAEADFEDEPANNNFDHLAPVVPLEADFD